MSSDDYDSFCRASQAVHESLCRRCGACCGAFGDPCVHLKKDESGRTLCTIYDRRLGRRVTVSGEAFTCVEVRDILHEEWRGRESCAYYSVIKEMQNIK